MNTELIWKILTAMLEVLSGWVIGSFVHHLIIRSVQRSGNRFNINQGVWTFIASLSNMAFKIAGVVVGLDQIGVNMNLIVGALSALGVGLSLALKNNMGTIASGMQILLTRPFKVGDYIQIGKYEGTVKSIELTYTVLDTINDNTVILPNNKAIKKTLINYSQKPDRRLLINVPCKKEDVDQVQKQLLLAASDCPLILKDPAPDVWINAFYYNGVTLQLAVYCLPQTYWDASTQIMNAIHARVDTDHYASEEMMLASLQPQSPSQTKKQSESSENV